MLLINGLGKIEEKINLVNIKLEEINNLYENNKLEKNNEDKLKEEIENLKTNWFKAQDKLAFFIEHDELEKVSKCLVVLEENCKNNEYTNALEDGKEFIYWLNHFREKDSLKLKNIF